MRHRQQLLDFFWEIVMTHEFDVVCDACSCNDGGRISVFIETDDQTIAAELGFINGQWSFTSLSRPV